MGDDPNRGDPDLESAADDLPDYPARARSWRTSTPTRVGLSVFFVVWAVMVLWYPLPSSKVKRAAPSWWVPATELIGLQQNWAMFSPDPPGFAMTIDAIVADSEGREYEIDLPGANPLTGSVFTERYRKFAERVYPTSSSDLWSTTARWFTRLAEDRGITPSTVTLRRTWVVTDLPDQPSSEVPLVFEFFRLDVKTDREEYLDPDYASEPSTAPAETGPPAPEGDG